MKYIPMLFLAFISITLFSACKKIGGEGEVIQEERRERNFVKVKSVIDAKIFIRQASEFKVTLKGQQNILDLLETTVENHTLDIKFKSNSRIASHAPIEIYINMPQVTGVELNGSGDIKLFNPFVSRDFEADVNGSGNIRIESMTVETMRATISGSGNIIIDDGYGDFENLVVKGSGSMDFSSFEVEEANVAISGSGDVKVNATRKLKINISGSGNVYYKGDPEVDQDISGSGSVKRL